MDTVVFNCPVWSSRGSGSWSRVCCLGGGVILGWTLSSAALGSESLWTPFYPSSHLRSSPFAWYGWQWADMCSYGGVGQTSSRALNGSIVAVYRGVPPPPPSSSLSPLFFFVSLCVSKTVFNTIRKKLDSAFSMIYGEEIWFMEWFMEVTYIITDF